MKAREKEIILEKAISVLEKSIEQNIEQRLICTQKIDKARETLRKMYNDLMELKFNNVESNKL
jgi:flagellar biosynthesis chaperone FliJ